MKRAVERDLGTRPANVTCGPRQDPDLKTSASVCACVRMCVCACGEYVCVWCVPVCV